MTKQITQKIKGLAILIMIAHHFLGYDFGANFSNTWVGIGSSLKICVGIYAVLSGYGYFFSREKTVKYGLNKVWGLLQEYWITLFTIFIPCAVVRGGWTLTPKSLFINLFAFGPNLNWNAWYVYFFAFCMLVMPFIYRVFRFRPVINVASAIAVPYLLEVGVIIVFPNYQDVTFLLALFSCLRNFGIFLVGYLMAQYDVIRKMHIPWSLGLLCMVGAIVLRIALHNIYTYGFHTDVFWAPLFVVGAAKFYEGIPVVYTKIFDVFGKHSTGMWFFHAVFFATYVKDIFQPLMTVVRHLPVMYVWLVLLSLVGAVFYENLLAKLRKMTLWVKRSM